MILSAQSIRRRCVEDYPPLIDPFVERDVSPGGKSFGLGPASYDVRLDQRLRLPPRGFALASTPERFCMPLDVAATVRDKSTWARVGLAVQNTHLDPGWSGWLTLEISNNSLDEIVINAGEPIAQLVFELLDVPTEQPYAGKYQHQKRGPQSALDETPPAVAGQRELNERFEHIERAYHAALDGRYPETVSVLDLQPAILAAATPASKRLPRCSAGGRARLSAERTSCCANSGSASDDRRARRHHHRARWQSRSSSMSR